MRTDTRTTDVATSSIPAVPLPSALPAAPAEPIRGPGGGGAAGSQGRQGKPQEVHRLLAAAFETLDEAGIDWLLLRGVDDLARPRGDIDILVRPGSLAAVASVLAPLGFRSLLAPGHGSHRFLVACSEDGVWLKLDLVTELAYGRRKEILAAHADAVLARRARVDGLATLAVGDGLWALLLHRIADPPARADDGTGSAGFAVGREGEQTLHRLAAEGDPTSPLAAILGPAAKRIVELLEQGDTSNAARLTRLALRRDRARRPASVASRMVRHELVRLGRRARSSLGLPARSGGLVVALLGPDGAGKSSLAATLPGALPMPVRARYLGLYGASNRRLVDRLHATAGLARLARIVVASVAASLDRRRGRVVVFDRHAYDLVGRERPARRRLSRRLYLRAAVRPDLTLVLDAPPHVLHERRPEHSLDVVASEAAHYRELAARLPGAVLIDAGGTREAVAVAAQRAIWDRLRDGRR